MANVAFKKGSIANIDSVPIIEGQVLFAYDEDKQRGSIYLDKDSTTRIKMDKEGNSVPEITGTASKIPYFGTDGKLTEGIPSVDVLGGVQSARFMAGATTDNQYTQVSTGNIIIYSTSTPYISFGSKDSENSYTAKNIKLTANRESLEFDSNLIPGSSYSISLGSSNNKWNNLYLSGTGSAGGDFNAAGNIHAGISTMSSTGTGVALASNGSVILKAGSPRIQFWRGTSATTANAYITNNSDNVLYAEASKEFVIGSLELRVQPVGDPANIKIEAYRSENINISLQANAGQQIGVYGKKSSSIEGWMLTQTSSGTGTVSTSDRRLKNEIGGLKFDKSLILLRDIPLMEFTYKTDEDNIVYNGIYAQDLRDILINNNIENSGYLLIQNKDENHTIGYDVNQPEADNMVYSVDYTKFIPTLWNGWKYHDTKIERLEGTIAELQDEIVVLKAQLLAM